MITFKEFLMICEGKKKKERKKLTKGIVVTNSGGNYNLKDIPKPPKTAPGSRERDIQVKEIMRNSGAKAIQKELERRGRENGG